MTPEDAVRQERSAIYGEPIQGLRNIGFFWTGVLRSWLKRDDIPPIPSHIVALMMAGLKLSRAAAPFGHHPDDFLDARTYMNIAEDGSKEYHDGHD